MHIDVSEAVGWSFKWLNVLTAKKYICACIDAKEGRIVISRVRLEAYILSSYQVTKILVWKCFSRGHADAEIEAVFAKYDVDGDRILDEDECKKMQEDLEGQKVNCEYNLGMPTWENHCINIKLLNISV